MASKKQYDTLMHCHYNSTSLILTVVGDGLHQESVMYETSDKNHFSFYTQRSTTTVHSLGFNRIMWWQQASQMCIIFVLPHDMLFVVWSICLWVMWLWCNGLIVPVLSVRFLDICIHSCLSKMLFMVFWHEFCDTGNAVPAMLWQAALYCNIPISEQPTGMHSF